MKDFWEKLKKPIVALAPMAGYTDSAYRQLVKSVCNEVVCFTEFTSSDGIAHNSKRTIAQVEFNRETERPIVAQIFGKNPKNFQIAAKFLEEELGVDAIDINMGCPAKKVFSSDHGSAMLKNPTLAAEIVQAIDEVTNLPVSVKTRVGVDKIDVDFMIDFCQKIEKAGARLITLHGRTAKQMYQGLADWNIMYEIKKNIKIPVIGNGDIRSKEDAIAKLGNLDGIMIGRGTMGNVWVMGEIYAALHNKEFNSPKTFYEKLPWFIKHCELNAECKGERIGMMEMRKHLATYVKGLPNAAEIRSKLVRVESFKEAKEILMGIGAGD